MTSGNGRHRFDPSVNYYQILDVRYGATREEIVRAYRQIMRHTHPDNFIDPGQRAKAEERAKLINAAYTVLSKPEIRREYDAHVRLTAMSDAVMQRYTGNAPGRPSPLGGQPRPPSPHVVRAQRQAYNSAVRQVLLTTAAFVVGLIVLALIVSLATSGFDALLG